MDNQQNFSLGVGNLGFGPVSVFCGVHVYVLFQKNTIHFTFSHADSPNTLIFFFQFIFLTIHT